ncbi:EngC GTPase [Legionella adelaidensis]|uniref:Small ribosomal subunit biogenesis GTPase RsgA n=1 Tax=Legionella adelaidensis TaxID=45056 RepID=A0A0W0R613_9GAMM|nr:small ribosomal subunit biogenesis GTPase RsgA [Legionella adelaidensis]KTC66496.1 EngC GTPase [Legionella adelaidensis]
MSKRRISKQQSVRIQNKQESLLKQNPAIGSPVNNGLVICRHGKHAEIEDELRQRIHCSIRPTLDSIVAGDQIIWQKEGEEQGVIVGTHPRISVLGRPDKKGIVKPIAANITQILIVVAPKPAISWSLLDSYLVVAEYLKMQACIILNKFDLVEDALEETLRNQYEPLGYSILSTSFNQPKGYKQLLETLDNQTSVFVGQSGVGKSSLISKVLPHESNILTAPISQAEFGKHTTSNSYFYHLPTGGALIDSPGVREFGLWHMPSSEIATGFREFKKFLSSCKFRNCNHDHVPGCSLIQAVKDGFISKRRYENYVKITAQFSK